MRKIKLTFTYKRYQALFLVMRAMDFDAIPDYDKRVMARFILERVFAKVSRRVISGISFKSAKLTLHPAEATAMHELLVHGTAPLGDYENGLVYEIIESIEQQTLHMNKHKLLHD